MAKQTINIGTAELAGDGETLRSAFDKVNDNFTELYNDDAADITLASFSVGAEGTPSGDGSIAYDNTTGVFTYTPPASTSAMNNLVEDTTPQLGGNLDMNGFEIVTTNGGHIRLDPDTTGGVGIGNVTNAATLLHLQQSAPIITLQRLDNTLSQGISWTGQNGVEAAHIKLDGTGGTTNTLIMSAFDGSSVTERLRIMAAVGKGIKVTGDIESGGVLKLVTTQGNDNIQLEPNGTGNVLLKGDKVGIGIVNQPDTLLHLKDTNSVITLQRTNDAGTPGISFQQSGGNARAELKMDGTSGTSNEVFIKTDNQDGQGLVERLRVGHTGVTIAGTLNGHTIPGGTGTIALTSDITSSGISNVVEDTTPQLGGDLDCQGFNITMDNGIISTSAGNLQLSSFNYVTIDSANNGQIEIGRSSGQGDVIIGKESNGTSVSFEGIASFTERAKFFKGVEEKFATTNGATGVTAINCANGHVHYLTAPAGDITANFTNLSLTQEYATNITIIIDQGNTQYEVTAVQIGGVAQTIIWQGNGAPTGTANGVDSFSFTILNDGGTYVVLGQMVAFGGV